MMIRRRKEKARMATGTDEDKDNYCCHKVMTMRRRRRTTRTADGKDYCDEVTMMKRRTRTRTNIWLPLDNTLFITPDIFTNG